MWLPYDWYLLYSAGANLVDAVRDDDPDLALVARKARDQVTRAVDMLRENLVNQEPINEPVQVPALPRRLLGWLDHASTYFTELGWRVERVGSEKRGYDTECTREDGRVLHVEIKGTQARGEKASKGEMK